jgi:hypothetical protein
MTDGLPNNRLEADLRTPLSKFAGLGCSAFAVSRQKARQVPDPR